MVIRCLTNDCYVLDSDCKLLVINYFMHIDRIFKIKERDLK